VDDPGEVPEARAPGDLPGPGDVHRGDELLVGEVPRKDGEAGPVKIPTHARIPLERQPIDEGAEAGDMVAFQRREDAIEILAATADPEVLA